MEELLVVKQNIKGEETWRYTARVVARQDGAVLVEANFDRDDRLFFDLPLRRGDRFLEAYYSCCWYNIFEIHDRDDDTLKGWYCNVARPAVFSDETVSYVDLALDLLVFPDGRQLVLDEDEFAALELDEDTRRQARAGLEELKTLFASPRPLQLR